MRADKWSIEKTINMMMLRHLFTLNGSQIKMVIESLCYLGHMVPGKYDLAKSVADQLVLIQGQKGHINLLDFSVTLRDILLPDFYDWLSKLVDRSQEIFGFGPEVVRFQPVDLGDLEGTFGSKFSSTACLSNTPITAAPIPVATSSATDSQGNSRAEMMAKVSKAHPSFAEKLQQFGE